MQQKRFMKLLSLLLVFCLLVGMLPYSAWATETADADVPMVTAAETIPVASTEEQLRMLIQAAPVGEFYAIEIGQITVSSPIVIPAGKKILLVGRNTKAREVSSITAKENENGKWEGNKNIFEVAAGATLGLERVAVDGSGIVRCIYMIKANYENPGSSNQVTIPSEVTLKDRGTVLLSCYNAKEIIWN